MLLRRVVILKHAKHPRRQKRCGAFGIQRPVIFSLKDSPIRMLSHSQSVRWFKTTSGVTKMNSYVVKSLGSVVELNNELAKLMCSLPRQGVEFEQAKKAKLQAESLLRGVQGIFNQLLEAQRQRN
jgi:hypothetical protein